MSAPDGRDVSVQDALAHCAHVTRQHSGTFWLGTRLLPARTRAAIVAVYAVCRTGDDAVDEAPNAEAARAGLARWWRHVENAYAGAPDPTDSLEVALAWTLRRHPVPHDAFVELYQGLASDLRKSHVDTMEALLLYCRRVGGVVGWMVAPVVGYRGGTATLRDALALGQAMQLTNVLRDVGEDLARGRVYLPADRMAYFGVTPADLEAGRITAGYVALLEELSAHAHGLYRQGWRSIPQLRGTTPLAVGTATLAYASILTRLRHNGYDNLTRRAHLTPLERVALVPAVAGHLLAGRTPRRVRRAPAASSAHEAGSAHRGGP